MPILPRRFERLKQVLDCRMSDLTVLVEHVEKPHNLSAILRSCDAVGVLEAHASSVNSRESETPKRPRRREASTCAKGVHAPDAPRHAEQHGPLLSVCYSALSKD